LKEEAEDMEELRMTRKELKKVDVLARITLGFLVIFPVV